MQQVHQYLSIVAGRHLAAGRFAAGSSACSTWSEGRSRQSSFEAAAARDIICWRHQVFTDLEHQGVLFWTSFPRT